MRRISTNEVIASSEGAAVAGFRWERDTVHRGLNEKWTFSRVVVTNPTLFERYFPGVIFASLDGVSLRIRCGAIARQNPRMTDHELRKTIIYALRRISMKARH